MIDKQFNIFDEEPNDMLEQYHSDLIALFITALFSVLIYVTLTDFLGNSNNSVSSRIMSLFASIISAVMVTTFYYIYRLPVII